MAKIKETAEAVAEVITEQEQTAIAAVAETNETYLATRKAQDGIYEGTLAIATTVGQNYKVVSPLTGAGVILNRGTDFGVIPKTKQPSLFKSGAEKVCMSYGLMQRFCIESKIETLEPEAFFAYTVKCDLVKIGTNGTEYVFCSGFGSANTKEKRNGFNDAFNAANSTLKMAQKRALVQAALAVSGLSSMFSQDMENETFMQGYTEIANTVKGGTITSKQVQRLFAIADDSGLNGQQAKKKLAEMGYTKASDISQDKYEEVCEEFRKLKEN